MALERVADRLLATPTARLPYQRNVLLRSYVIERADGNVIIYNSPGISDAADAIRDLGPTSHLLINHAHESMYGAPALDVPIWVHQRDSGEVERDLTVAATFTARRWIGDDLEVIPTPGHTAGTTSFLWHSGDRRYLFTGDFIWIEQGEWKAVVLDPGLRDEYVASLELVRDLDFDVLVPWGTTDDGPSFDEVSSQQIRERLDAIIARVRAGGTR